MVKPRIIIADTDSEYTVPLQLKFAEDFFEKVDLEVITDRDYFQKFFSVSQSVDIMVISESMYDRSLERHNIRYIFLLTEQYEEDSTANLKLHHILKYTSIREIFNEIIGKSGDVLKSDRDVTKEPQVVLFYSAAGGVGKTTLAMGVSACLTKNYKKVLYLNAAHLQSFQHMLENPAPITASDVYARLGSGDPARMYHDIKHVIRKEVFSYLPPFKAVLMSLDLRYSVFASLVRSAQKSGDYDFIIVDADTAFDENKAELINLADKVVVVTDQNTASVCATNLLVSNINGMNTDKYIFVCNNYDKTRSNALISPQIQLKFTVSDYIDHFRTDRQLKPEELARESGIQTVAFLIN